MWGGDHAAVGAGKRGAAIQRCEHLDVGAEENDGVRAGVEDMADHVRLQRARELSRRVERGHPPQLGRVEGRKSAGAGVKVDDHEIGLGVMVPEGLLEHDRMRPEGIAGDGEPAQARHAAASLLAVARR